MWTDFIRPRWGIGSVRLHLDIDDLALGLILFDRIVLPGPDGTEEFARFTDAGWRPGEQVVRGVQLDPLLHFVEWNDELRQRWRRGMQRWADRFGPLAGAVEGLGYQETANVLADSSWLAVDHDDDSILARPVPHAWCPATTKALARQGMPASLETEEPAAQTEAIDLEYGAVPEPEPDDVGTDVVLASRELLIPSHDNEADTLENARAMALDPEFVSARAEVFTAIFAMAAQGVPAEEIADRLAAAEERFVAKMEEYAGGDVRRAIHLLVPSAAGVGARAIGAPGGPASWVVRKGLAKMAPLPERAQGTGQALGLARRVLPCVYSETPAGDEVAEYSPTVNAFVDSGLATVDRTREG